MKTDVLVIGGGTAGMFCAAEASKHCNVTVVTEGNHVFHEPAGFALPANKYASCDEFLSETMKAGCLTDKNRLTETLCTEGFALRDGFSIKTSEFHMLENVRVMRINAESGKVSGGYCFDTVNKRWFYIAASCIVLATGGFGGLLSDKNASLFGCDGIAMAYHAGAYIRDMEFIKFGEYIHTLGGIEINEKCETKIPGLFACGEAAGGIHGADCIAENLILDEIIFGRIAGKSAAEYVEHEKNDENVVFESDDMPVPFDASEYSAKIREAAAFGLSCPRSKTSMDEAFRIVKDIADKTEKYTGSFDGFRVHNEAATAAIALWSASVRLGSRGCHVRLDNKEERNVAYSRFCFKRYGKLHTERRGFF